MQSRTFIFSGGGTGGHIYPALAIAESLAEVSHNLARCVFICSDRPLDERILKAHGVEFHRSPAKPLVMRPRGLIRFLRSWGSAVRHSRRLMQQIHKNPPIQSDSQHHAIELVAMGGFVAGPSVQAARVEKVPVTLVNLDAVPGKANRWIARHSGRIFSATPIRAVVSDIDRWVVMPPIVRKSATVSLSKKECKERLGLDPARPVLMITGGSQGAKSINQLATRVAGMEPTWQIIHQTGKGEADAVRDAYRLSHTRAVVEEFVSEMALWWGAADLAIARAGAGNVAEVWANHVPTVFLPYPFHRDQHQAHNAKTLVDSSGCWIRTDHVDVERNLSDAGKLIIELMNDPERLAMARQSLQALGPADGAERVARQLWNSAPHS